MAKDFLLEIGTEELPAHAVKGLYRALREMTGKRLDEMGIGHGVVHAMGTPRRLTVFVDDVDEAQPDKTTERRGPSVEMAYDADGKPTKALEGFARGAKVSVDSLVKKDGYVYAQLHAAGRATRDILAELFPALINDLPMPNTMRWGALDFRFLRPIRWIVALWGNEVVPFEIAAVKSGNRSRGHRVLSNGDGQAFDPSGQWFTVSEAKNYLDECEAHFVIPCPVRRGKKVRAEIEKVAAACLDKQGRPGHAQIEDGLFEEVNFLVEWPTALAGNIDAKFMALPPEAIITPMRDHQRYFPVLSADNELLPYFITVRNGGDRALDTVQHGNERVLRARLADAQFFFDEDRKKSLAEHLAKLNTVVFQEGLGTVYDKAKRLEKLAGVVAKMWPGVDAATAAHAQRAALLAKADLTTSMVVEFTELQGTIGRSYALLDGEAKAVADAIDEHYRPRFAGDVQPDSATGAIVSLADKIDTLVGYFSVGKIPTGSQDPFALRRQGLGLVLLLIEKGVHISLAALMNAAMDGYGMTDAAKRAEVAAQLMDFLRQRLTKVLEEKSIRYDVAAAALADADDPASVVGRAETVAAMLKEQPAIIGDVATAFGRAANLAAKATAVRAVDPARFVADAEKALYKAYGEVKAAVDEAVAAADYQRAVVRMAELAPAIDSFFDAVMVMDKDENIRENRLALLTAIDAVAKTVADFGQIVAEK